MGRKIEVQEIVNKLFNFAKQFLRPPQSCAHGTCHASHTLDTPLCIIDNFPTDVISGVDFLKIHQVQIRGCLLVT